MIVNKWYTLEIIYKDIGIVDEKVPKRMKGKSYI